jgi:hypothetical protein
MRHIWQPRVATEMVRKIVILDDAVLGLAKTLGGYGRGSFGACHGSFKESKALHIRITYGGRSWTCRNQTL